jgi:hypothetical protein
MRNEGNAQYVDVFNQYLKRLAPEGFAEFKEGIEDKLKKFTDSKYQVNFHWNNGNIMFKNCKSTSDQQKEFNQREFYQSEFNRKMLEVESDGGSFYQFKPKKLEVFSFDSPREDFSFMRLGYQGLQLTGLNEEFPPNYELLARINNQLYSSEIFDLGFIETEHDKIPLPDNIQRVERILRNGNLIIVSKGSALNDSQLNDIRLILQQKGKKARIYKKLRDSS